MKYTNSFSKSKQIDLTNTWIRKTLRLKKKRNCYSEQYFTKMF